MAEGVVVVVAGLPGSGKTTLARALAPMLGLPLLSKDVIKEALFDALGTGSSEWAGQLSRAAHVAMYALAGDMDTVIVEAFFQRGMAEADLLQLGRPLVQLYCHCATAIALDRYRARALDPDRHPGHLPEHQPHQPHWADSEPTPLDLPGPLVEVRTDGPVDLAAVAEEVARHLRPPRPT